LVAGLLREDRIGRNEISLRFCRLTAVKVLAPGHPNQIWNIEVTVCHLSDLRVGK